MQIMKKLLLLVVISGFFLSGCAGSGEIGFGGKRTGMQLFEGYSLEDLSINEHEVANQDDFYSRICEGDFQANFMSMCRKDFCGWKGWYEGEKGACLKYCTLRRDGVKKHIFGREAWCTEYDNSKTKLSNRIKGKGWRRNIEYTRNDNALCTGKKSIPEFVTDWERISKEKCKDGDFDCIESTFERCELRAVQTEWLDRQKIEEQYEEKKAALCAGKLHPRPYKLWFEWKVCKEYREIAPELNYISFSKLSCPVVSEIFLKAEKESCGR